MEAAQEQRQLTGAGVAGLALGANLNVPCREKTWDEMNTEQRIEKMREEVRYLRRTVTDLERTINSLKRHQHSQDGSLLVPLHNRSDEDRPRGYFYDPLK